MNKEEVLIITFKSIQDVLFEFGVIRVVADIAAEVKTGFYIERQLRKTHRAKQRK